MLISFSSSAILKYAKSSSNTIWMFSLIILNFKTLLFKDKLQFTYIDHTIKSAIQNKMLPILSENGDIFFKMSINLFE